MYRLQYAQCSSNVLLDRSRLNTYPWRLSIFCWWLCRCRRKYDACRRLLRCRFLLHWSGLDCICRPIWSGDIKAMEYPDWLLRCYAAITRISQRMGHSFFSKAKKEWPDYKNLTYDDILIIYPIYKYFTQTKPRWSRPGKFITLICHYYLTLSP